MTREQMIKALTTYELQWLVDNPEHLQGVAEFFAGGGFRAWSDAQLEKKCSDNVWLEVEA